MIIASTSCCCDHASDQKDDEDQPHKIFERHGDAHRDDHDQFSVSRNSAPNSDMSARRSIRIGLSGFGKAVISTFVPSGPLSGI
jgi:hypothetical protein